MRYRACAGTPVFSHLSSLQRGVLRVRSAISLCFRSRVNHGSSPQIHHGFWAPGSSTGSGPLDHPQVLGPWIPNQPRAPGSSTNPGPLDPPPALAPWIPTGPGSLAPPPAPTPWIPPGTWIPPGPWIPRARLSPRTTHFLSGRAPLHLDHVSPAV